MVMTLERTAPFWALTRSLIGEGLITLPQSLLSQAL